MVAVGRRRRRCLGRILRVLRFFSGGSLWDRGSGTENSGAAAGAVPLRD